MCMHCILTPNQKISQNMYIFLINIYLGLLKKLTIIKGVVNKKSLGSPGLEYLLLTVLQAINL